MKNLCDCGLLQLGAKFCDLGGEKENPPKFTPATKRHRAIDLSCVRCDGDGRRAWIPDGGLRSAPFPPPTSDFCKVAAHLDYEIPPRLYIQK